MAESFFSRWERVIKQIPIHGGNKRMAVASKISKQAASAPAVISLNPDSFVAGGGLITDVDVVFTALQFLMWDYDGHVAVAVPALGVTMRLVGEEDDPDESKDHDQYYSCGNPEDFAPNADGSGLVPVGSKTGLTNSTNAGIFLASLKNVGVPTSLFETGNIGAFVGLKCHIQRVPAPERSNQQVRPDGRKPEICIVTKLIALPGEGGTGATGNVASKPGLSKVTKANTGPTPVPTQTRTAATANSGNATANAATADAGSELDDVLTPVLLQIVADAGGSIQRKMIGPKVFQAFKDDKSNQGPMMRRASNEDYLMGLTEAGFTYDGATLSLG